MQAKKNYGKTNDNQYKSRNNYTHADGNNIQY